jgi:8-oxo-dGTP diphosphatase
VTRRKKAVPDKPRKICATLCYIRKGAKTLMLHRVKKKNDIHEGKWNGLGGKMEAGETPEECVIREVREESGLRIDRPELRAILTFPEFDGHDDWLVFLFVADRFSGELIDSDEGNLKWIETRKLPELPLWEGDRLFLKWMEQERFFSAKFVYKQGRLLEHHVCFHGPDESAD